MGRCVLAAALLALVAAAPSAQGRAEALANTPARTFVTNGPVYAIAPTADAVYIGGDFTEVGPRTGPAVGIDASTGRSLGFPEVAGSQQVVNAVAPDGSGGFYIGGGFARVGGVPIRNLAHVLADGSLDTSFAPNPSGAVRALAVAGS